MSNRGIMPSGIAAAFGSSTPAMQAKMAGARGGRRSAAKRRKRRSAAAKTTRRRTRRRSSKVGRKRLVKGSAAAKAWGRKMKRLRRK